MSEAPSTLIEEKAEVEAEAPIEEVASEAIEVSNDEVAVADAVEFNGGGFVTGVTSLNMSNSSTTIKSSETAHVYIYKGTFGNSGSVDSFNVYDNAIVVFGAGGKDYFGKTATADDFKNAIVLNASNASIAANGIAQNSKSNEIAKIYVYYGTYNGKCTWLDGYCHSGTFYKTYNRQLGYTYASYVIHSDVEDNTTTVVFYSQN